MNETSIKPILGKYIISGRIVLLSGTRVGGSDIGISIGGLDNPVIRNPLTGQPYLPGSSLKGKMRALLERLKKKELKLHGSGKNAIRRHECADTKCEICRLFGSSPKFNDEKTNIPSRIIVRDAHLTEESRESLERMETDAPYTEWKMENALDRVTCHASPRSFERVPANAEFSFEIIYTAEKADEIEEDLRNIFTALELIEDDYIGSSGSRGYGKVRFEVDRLIVKPESYYKGEQQNVISFDLKDKSVSRLKERVSELKQKLLKG
ncbi:type III-A CRISPR-associated RAMP protein Csm3 [Pseudothermotoga sp.]|nr:type III-A CRISPR-associated RAMP protein Csm3 [Pseudothermotoga sp.]MCX7812491.1 type III-A CRISPR-associated RAMP protein Csm3 [Pseudothermotoga sp.]MDW8140053.1 type III-A CRISPR-associated RAMP protein Csm3 [Pseudothermotoga sp.]